MAQRSRVSLQAADGDKVHIIERQLGELGYHRLDEDGRLLGIEAHGEIVEGHLDDVLPHFLRVVGIVGECLRVGNEDKHAVEVARILQFDAPTKRPDVVS